MPRRQRGAGQPFGGPARRLELSPRSATVRSVSFPCHAAARRPPPSPSSSPAPPLVQTLALYWRRRRFLDFSLFLVGFGLAGIYHWLHMLPEVR